MISFVLVAIGVVIGYLMNQIRIESVFKDLEQTLKDMERRNNIQYRIGREALVENMKLHKKLAEYEKREGT